jgi:hypothetical protein
VRSLNRWMRDRSPQPYALAAALEVEGSAEPVNPDETLRGWI